MNALCESRWTEGDLAALRRRWTRLVPAAQPSAHALADAVLARYREPWRCHHDVRHLIDVLEAVDFLTANADDVASIELAAWFHDAVYRVPGRPDASPGSAEPHVQPTEPATQEATVVEADNEAASALLAQRLLDGVLDPARVAEVSRLVRLTRAHDPAPDDRSGGVLCDADLAVLARPPERYDDYRDRIRREYAHVDDAVFRRGRAAILSDLLARRHLYATPQARDRWESTARVNIARELSLLA